MAQVQRAIVVKEPGPASVLTLVNDFPVPARQPGELLVKVASTSVNPIDFKVRSGAFGPPPSPWVPGGEIAGVVQEADADSKFKPGDKVFALTNTAGPSAAYGSYVEWFPVKEEWAAIAPTNIPLSHAGGVPLAALTAWQALDPHTTLTAPGKRVLVLAASGGVGHFAVQFAKAFGAHVVGVAGPSSQDFLKELGVDERINYRTHSVEDAAANGPFDVVVDLIGGQQAKDAYKVTKPDGLFAHIWNSGSDRAFIEEISQLHEQGHGARVTKTITRASGEELAEIAGLIEAGKVKVVVQHVYPLEQAVQAHEHLERGSGVQGKILITVQDV